MAAGWVFVAFPHAAHDDGPDALEMAVEAARPPEFSITVVYHGQPARASSPEERLRRFITGADIVERDRYRYG